MRLTIILSLLAFLCINLFGQDKVIMKDGRTIDCKIQSINSSSVNIYLINNRTTLVPVQISKVDSLVWFSNIPAYTKYLQENGFIKEKTKPEFISGNYLYMFDKTVIKGKTIEYKKPFLGNPHFLVDEKKYSNDQVKFFQNNEGFYANIKYLKGSYSSVFARNVRKSRISLFEQTTHTTYMQAGYGGGYNNGFGNTGGGGMYFGPSTSYTKYYYNKAYNDLKKVNYENLLYDMADDPLALAMLQKYEKTRKNGVIFVGVSASLLGVGLISLISKTSKTDFPNLTGEFVLIGAGTLGMWIKYFGWDQSKNPENIKKAIDTYNR